MKIDPQEILDELNKNASASYSLKHPGQTMFKSKYRNVQAVAICDTNSIAAQFIASMNWQNPRIFYDNVAKLGDKYNHACVPLLIVHLNQLRFKDYRFLYRSISYTINIKLVGSVIIRRAGNTANHMRQNMTSLSMRAERILKSLLLNISIKNFEPKFSGATFTVDFPEAGITLSINASGTGDVYHGTATKSLKLRYRGWEIIGNMGLEITVTRKDDKTDESNAQPSHARAYDRFLKAAGISPPTNDYLSNLRPRHSTLLVLTPRENLIGIMGLAGLASLLMRVGIE